MGQESQRVVRVDWWGPFGVDEVLSSKVGPEHVGVYQVYSHHVVFGANSLVYIGETQKSFGERIGQHQSRWMQYESDVSVRLGVGFKIVSGEDYKNGNDRVQLIGDVEALSIFWHSPPYNSSGITACASHRKNLRVQNWGDRGALLPEYSNHWLPARPDDDQKP